ncbi:DUF6236 family protein [Pseudomonas sp. MWU12-2037]|uniref:DUF6236 family protein n=1 Tax=Pseudomonas sp. MWU12-2037 TaxID=2928690 RepID=UPI00200EE434|nr:DUF6236 family protein [Pseudomonas sp. MWU12-2037]
MEFGAGENSIQVEDQPSESAIAMELFKALPVPAADVPLAEILAFKQKRRPELLMFRAYIEAMAKEISESSDSQAELKKKLQDLDQACANLIKVTREWQFPVHLANAKFSLNISLPKSVEAAVAGWKTAGELNLGITAQTVAATVMGVTSNFKITADPGLRPLKRAKSPYKYLYFAQKEIL